MKYKIHCEDCLKALEESDERHYAIALLAEVEWHLRLRREVIENEKLLKFLNGLLTDLEHVRLLLIGNKLKEHNNGKQ